MDEARNINRREEFKKTQFKQPGLRVEKFIAEMRILRKEELLQEMRKRVTQATNSEENLGNEEERIEILSGIHPEMTSPSFPLEAKLNCLYEALIPETDNNTLFYIIEALRVLLVESLELSIYPIIKQGFIPKLLSLVQGTDHTLIQTETSWCLNNIAASKYCSHLIQEGATDKILQVLETSTDPILKQNLMWTLGNIGGESVEQRDQLWESRLPDILLEFMDLNKLKLSTIKTPIWVLSTIFQKNPFPMSPKIMNLVQTLSHIFNSIEDKGILSDILWCFSYITENVESPDELIKYKIELFHKTIKELDFAKVIKLLEMEEKSIRTPTLMIIGNLTNTENVAYTELLLENELIKYLEFCMDNNHNSVIRETCWIISNIATGPPHHIDQIIQSELIALLFRVIKYQDITGKKEAIYVINNLVEEGTEIHRMQLIGKGLLPIIVDILHLSDVIMINFALKIALIILEDGKDMNCSEYQAQFVLLGAIDKFNEFAYHKNKQIRELAASIVDDYCSADDIESATQIIEGGGGIGEETNFHL